MKKVIATVLTVFMFSLCGCSLIKSTDDLPSAIMENNDIETLQG